MKYRVRVEQDDVSTFLWTLMRLIKYLKGFLHSWDTIVLETGDTCIIIERVE